MTRKATLITGALIALMGTTGLALAHDFGRGDDMRGGPRGAGMERMFENTDADGDGKITQAEVEAAAAARFAEADTDGDGLLSAEEMRAAAEARAEARRTARVERMLDRLDTDEDGFLSLEEAAARGPAARFDRMLDRLDTDEDGALSREELEEARAQMRGRHGKGEGRHRMGEGQRGGN